MDLEEIAKNVINWFQLSCDGPWKQERFFGFHTVWDFFYQVSNYQVEDSSLLGCDAVSLDE